MTWKFDVKVGPNGLFVGLRAPEADDAEMTRRMGLLATVLFAGVAADPDLSREDGLALEVLASEIREQLVR